MKHSIITCFKVKRQNGKWVTKHKNSKPAANGALHYCDYKIRSSMPANIDKQSLTVKKFNTGAYETVITNIINTIKQFPANKRDVCIMVHGYSFVTQKHHKLDLLYGMHTSYVQANSKIGHIVFFSWPGFGTSMITGLKDAVQIGRNLADHIDFFTALSDALKAENSNLHLLVQSWGNRLIAGFAEKVDLRYSHFNLSANATPVFKTIHLMAADVPSKSLDSNGERTNHEHYKLRRLSKMAEKIYVFYDANDRILETSKNQIETNFQRLGKIGYDQNNDFANFSFVDAEAQDPNLPDPSRLSNWNKRHQYFIRSSKIAKAVAISMKGFV